ncbi:MAG: hypothetical protein Ct9H300mP12_14690 [Acidimicrobiales bacterium]|nr:MAG: hypothetical protein Ct9H300mP12_14690 [Acidimicrobiales bacterium]
MARSRLAGRVRRRGFPPIEQYIFFDESQAGGCPIPFLTTNTVGPTIRQFGTDEQRALFLPKC